MRPSLSRFVYHYAILELVRLKEFRPDSRWIARMLGITTDEVNIALNRLIRLGLLEMVDRKRGVDKSGDTAESIDEFACVAVERLSEQVRRLFMAAFKPARGITATGERLKEIRRSSRPEE